LAPLAQRGGSHHAEVEAWARRSGAGFLTAYSSTRAVDRVLKFYRGNGFEGWFVQLYRDLSKP